MHMAPSLTRRVAVGKLVGLAVGVLAFLSLPEMQPGADPWLRWGLLLYYPTLGAIIGVFGVVTHHPVLDLPLPWWVRAPVVGGWMNLVLTFFAHDQMTAFMEAMLGAGHPLASPWWFVLEGALVGIVMGFAATLIGGEGPAALRRRAER